MDPFQEHSTLFLLWIYAGITLNLPRMAESKGAHPAGAQQEVGQPRAGRSRGPRALNPSQLSPRSWKARRSPVGVTSRRRFPWVGGTEDAAHRPSSRKSASGGELYRAIDVTFFGRRSPRGRRFEPFWGAAGLRVRAFPQHRSQDIYLVPHRPLRFRSRLELTGGAHGPFNTERWTIPRQAAIAPAGIRRRRRPEIARAASNTPPTNKRRPAFGLAADRWCSESEVRGNGIARDRKRLIILHQDTANARRGQHILANIFPEPSPIVAQRIGEITSTSGNPF